MHGKGASNPYPKFAHSITLIATYILMEQHIFLKIFIDY
jgi:hypothetical protein